MDPVRITQALDNLVSNAIKFSHPGTAVTVRAAQSDGKAVFAVEDEGQGIPGNELSRIFSEFVRTSVKPTAGEKCTGLGLAIVKRIVECHGGRVWVESEVGRGTKLSFEIPMEGPPSPPSCQGDRISF
jgi:signal transduction histidine kinase